MTRGPTVSDHSDETDIQSEDGNSDIVVVALSQRTNESRHAQSDNQSELHTNRVRQQSRATVANYRAYHTKHSSKAKKT